MDAAESEEKREQKLKYQHLIDQVELEADCSCPPANSMIVKIEAFRFVFENDPDLNSHKPAKVKSPKRIMKTAEENCSLCGLSCFRSAQEALSTYFNLVKARPNLINVLGDSLSIGNLDENSGMSTEVDSEGHFDLFEYSTFDPYQTFLFMQKIGLGDGNN